MNLHRRQILAAMGASALVGLPRPSFAATELTLGNSRITTLSDGNLVLPMEFLLGNLPAADAAPVLAHYGITGDTVEPPCNLTLFQDAERTVLFDAGSGSGFMPSAGKILEALDAIGVSADDITHVLFTHAHPDHLWGVLDDFDDPVFANASYMIGQAEWEYWTDPATVESIGAERASFAVGAARRLAAIEDLMEFIDGGQEVLPGILAHDTPGHTPGHMAFEIRQGTEAALVVGDAIGNGHLAFARPDWASGSDQDAETGIATRTQLLDQLATDQMAMVGFHLPGGGLGRVERDGEAYRFVAEV
ncbi:MBL fold metallo-hydrolase [uncultured Roseovarius sp.]|uniref:MBL fold metallo-hydrolase n=1 Tax=uncultured Roseovarius sp. TaxID=293344 RepID=UPI000C42D94B|nr:MBL fold metallo-hydrolase [Roseovarius sp.]MBD11335.1 MBL fold metallo-hydrolase [Roseovarius sp.]HCQ56860.1 MBL fold metallo-hydrolase [Sulfitobacter sp.]|tara:strand:+ start:705 stop:1619 length:915 start_codon:yes stop_codon:yes gene_type:complete